MRSSFALALVLALAAPALAQDLPIDPEQERQAEYAQCFADGLAAITRRDLALSERLFKRCVELVPDAPVAYYNLACTFSLAEKADEAVAFLRESFKRGFVDVSHMGRDMDLDPIRRTPQFRACLAEFEQTLLGPCGPALSHVPAGKLDGLLVWVHDQGAPDPRRDLERLQAALPTWAILVPQGVAVRGVHAWDDRCEFVVMERLRAFSAQQSGLPARAIVAGEGNAGALALGIAVHHPEAFGGVLASGPNLGAAVDEDLTPTGTRAYLIAHREDAAQVESAVAARNHFAKAKSPVVLERYPLPNALAQDRAVLLRALSWLAGQPVQLPGAGVEQTF